MSLTPEQRAYGERSDARDAELYVSVRRAQTDRDRLADLRRRGLVEVHDWGYEHHYPHIAASFRADIEARAFRARNTAIRPKGKPKKKRR